MKNREPEDAGDRRERLQQTIGVLMCKDEGLDRRNLFQQDRRERTGEHHGNRDDNAQHLSTRE